MEELYLSHYSEEEQKIIQKFLTIRDTKTKKLGERQEKLSKLTDYENSVIYKWGFKKDINDAVKEKNIKRLLTISYLIMKESVEDEILKHGKVFKDKDLFEKTRQEIISHFCSQYQKLR